MITFLQTLPLFSNWTKSSLKNLQANFVKRYCIRNTTVYKEGDASRTVYIVKNGEFQESCKVELKNELNNNSFKVLLEERKLGNFRSTFCANELMTHNSRLRNVDVIFVLFI